MQNFENYNMTLINSSGGVEHVRCFFNFETCVCLNTGRRTTGLNYEIGGKIPLTSVKEKG